MLLNSLEKAGKICVIFWIYSHSFVRAPEWLNVNLDDLLITKTMDGSLCCWRFTFSPEEIEQRTVSKMIDKDLEKERRDRKKQVCFVNVSEEVILFIILKEIKCPHWGMQVRVLLLGAGESGKSTFLKQMRIIHNLGFDPDTVRDFQHVIYQNCIQGNIV